MNATRIRRRRGFRPSPTATASGASRSRRRRPSPAKRRSATQAATLVRDSEGGLVFAASETRWVGSGRIVYDNKGNPVKAYEPFFDSSPVYDDESDLVEWGVTSITRYDPLSRPVRVDNPNGTLARSNSIRGGPSRIDENDTVLESAWYEARSGGALGEPEAERRDKAAAHANTPASADLDSLGRTFPRVADNGADGQYTTALDARHRRHALSTSPTRAGAVFTQVYDLAGAEIAQRERRRGRALGARRRGRPAAAGVGQSRHRRRSEYDALRRPTSCTSRQPPGADGSPSEPPTARRSRARRSSTCAACPTSSATAGSRHDRAARLQGQRAARLAPAPGRVRNGRLGDRTGLEEEHVHDHDRLRRAQPADRHHAPTGA